MLKKCLALLVVFALVIGVVPLGANAQSESARIEAEICRIYSTIQNVTGNWDLSGLCGTMVAYQLYYLGINTSPIILDGNNQYDAYKDMEFTSGGHRIRAYSAEQFDLREALYAVSNGGTKDVYNLLAGFQWTNSWAGQRYGHAVVIYAILNGKVYFCEGFNTPFDKQVGGPSICTIDEFADDYGRWSVFEGLIHFGQKDGTELVQEYSCNAFLLANENAELRSVPSVQQSAVLRTVKAGERLEAVGIYESEDKELYYRVLDSGKSCYIKAEDTKVFSMRYDDVHIRDAQYPEILKRGEEYHINGILVSTHNRTHNVMARILNEMGQEVDCFAIPVEGRYKNLQTSALPYEISFSNLYEGNYTLEISAEIRNHSVRSGKIRTETEKCILEQRPFTVGYSVSYGAEPRTEDAEVKTGWKYEEGKWYYYENGKAHTGWLCSGGVDYYLLEDGSAATGWHEVNGKMRFFSNTGAMRTGWLDDNGAVYYLLSNGVPVTGERTIDGVKHLFGTDGIRVNPAFWEE